MKKYVSGLLFLSLLTLSGCNSENLTNLEKGEEKSVFQFTNEIAHNSENFVTEEQILAQLPENTWYFSLHNSTELVDHFQKTYLTSIRKVEEYLSGDELQNVAATEVIAVLAFEQIKTVKNVQILLSASGDKLKKGEFPSWYMLSAEELKNKKDFTEEEKAELLEFLNSEICIKVQAEINNVHVETGFTELENSFEEFKKNADPDVIEKLTLTLEYNKDTNIYNFQAGECKNIPNFNEIKSNKSFTFATTVNAESPLFQVQVNKMLEMYELVKQDESFSEKNIDINDNMSMKMIFDIWEIMISEITKYNAITVTNAVTQKITAIDMTTDTISLSQIVKISAENERNILKEYMLGEALQYPYLGQDFIDYKFSLSEKRDILYFSDTVSNIDEYFFPKKMLKRLYKTYFFFLF